jgi:cellulose synthase/poly-beta-1,6-N-acetylglucosamine synthase-like glycosyltransferase
MTEVSDRSTPLVSVIVPAFNAARTIERCLGALVHQRGSHTYEVIVVDSGSDDTCRRARRVLPDVRLVELPQRALPPAARHVGASVARGSILAFVDSDIYVGPDWIDHVVRAATTGADLVCGPIENGNPESAVSRAEQLLMFNEFLPGTPEKPSWFALSGNMVMRRAAYERFGPFVTVRAAEDIVFSRQLINRGGTVRFVPSLLVRHENRTRLTPFLKNQWLLGRHTAAARFLVPFADTSSHVLFVLLLPISPVVKTLKIGARLARWNQPGLAALVREFPLFSLGLLVYCAGMTAATVAQIGRTKKPHAVAGAPAVAAPAAARDRAADPSG